eukprot:COSAG01_NODE_16873_length_1197_cov_1.664845_3_plen_21_part_01
MYLTCETSIDGFVPRGIYWCN